jgi:hypothetical protein
MSADLGESNVLTRSHYNTEQPTRNPLDLSFDFLFGRVGRIEDVKGRGYC